MHSHMPCTDRSIDNYNSHLYGTEAAHSAHKLSTLGSMVVCAVEGPLLRYMASHKGTFPTINVILPLIVRWGCKSRWTLHRFEAERHFLPMSREWLHSLQVWGQMLPPYHCRPLEGRKEGWQREKRRGQELHWWGICDVPHWHWTLCPTALSSFACKSSMDASDTGEQSVHN